MNDKLKEAFDTIRAEEELKESTKTFLLQKTKGYAKVRIMNYRRLASAAVCTLIMLLGGYWLYFTPTVEISIDINPSIELGVNRFDRIVSAESYNSDGQELLETVDVRHMGYYEAVNEILQNENIEILLANDEIMTIGVVGKDGKQSSRILSDIEACTAKEENTYCYHVYKEEVEAAHEMGLSHGKYKAFQELQTLEPDISAEEVQDMTMREIWELIQKLSGDDEEQTDTENEKGHGHQHRQESDNCRAGNP